MQTKGLNKRQSLYKYIPQQDYSELGKATPSSFSVFNTEHVSLQFIKNKAMWEFTLSKYELLVLSSVLSILEGRLLWTHEF